MDEPGTGEWEDLSGIRLIAGWHDEQLWWGTINGNIIVITTIDSGYTGNIVVKSYYSDINNPWE